MNCYVKVLGQRIHGQNIVASPESQAVNGENEPQPNSIGRNWYTRLNSINQSIPGIPADRFHTDPPAMAESRNNRELNRGGS